MTRADITAAIAAIDARIEFLKSDKTKIISAWAQSGPAYDHGPYYRRLERKRLAGKKKRLEIQLRKLGPV
jgi:hypothetical protein